MTRQPTLTMKKVLVPRVCPCLEPRGDLSEYVRRPHNGAGTGAGAGTLLPPARPRVIHCGTMAQCVPMWLGACVLGFSFGPCRCIFRTIRAFASRSTHQNSNAGQQSNSAHNNQQQQQQRYSPITLVGKICEMDAVDTNRVIDLSANDNIPLPAASAPMALSTGTSEPKQPPELGVNVDAPIANEPGRLITPVDADALIDSAIGMYDSSNYRRHDLIVSTQSRWRQVCDLSSPQQSN